MTVIPHAGSRRAMLNRSLANRHSTRTGVMSTSAFAIGALVVMSLGLLSLLLLNTALAKGSFRAHELRIMKADLAQREQLLRTQIEAASSPLTLSQRAKDLGLVANVSPVFIRMSDGTILGVPYAAGTPMNPATGEPLVGMAPTVTDPGATVTDDAVPATPSDTAPAAPVEPAAPAESEPSLGVATAPGTGTEQPLGITGD